MARGLRSGLPDGYFHATARGVDGEAIYRDERDYRAFLTLLLGVVNRFGWRMHALCLMTNHYHLVVEATRPQLSGGFHRLNGVYAQRFNHRHDRRGHLFGDRFWCAVIDSDEYLAAVCRYVLANPVRAGLCELPADWTWTYSSWGLDG